MRKSLWFDLSIELTGWSFFEDGNLVTFGSFTNHSENFGETLSLLYSHVTDLIYKVEPDVIGVEDIYCANVDTYKKLAGLQAIVYYIAYKYNNITPLFATASTIRKFEKLNIKPVSNYKAMFPNIDFSHFYFIRKYDDVYYDISRNDHLQKLTTTLKNGTTKVLGGAIKEYDYAKKIIIVDRVNKLFEKQMGGLLSYLENDIADAIYSNYVMCKFMLEE